MPKLQKIKSLNEQNVISDIEFADWLLYYFITKNAGNDEIKEVLMSVSTRTFEFFVEFLNDANRDSLNWRPNIIGQYESSPDLQRQYSIRIKEIYEYLTNNIL